MVGIEVKAAATVTATDFSGLRKLAEACGKRFILGMVLYDHDTTVPFGERLFALPISTLWKRNRQSSPPGVARQFSKTLLCCV